MTAEQESFYIQQFKLGDNLSFQTLYNYYHKRMLSYGKSLFPHYEDDVKDAYQDIFLALWKARERLVIDKTFDFYLKRSIKNHVINRRKKQLKFDSIHEDVELSENIYNEQSNALSSLINLELQQKKNEEYNFKLKLLTDRQRFLFTERVILEKSVEEIMEEHNLAKQTVYNTIYRCIMVLKTENRYKKFCKIK